MPSTRRANWRTEDAHPASWELSATLDHVIPVTRGGADDETNWVTTSMARNSAKSNWSLEEIGWSLHPPGDPKDWDGLRGWFRVHDREPARGCIGLHEDVASRGECVHADAMRRRPRLSPEVLRALQARCARVAVGPSTVRGQGASGVVAAARTHLATLPLESFGTAQPARFRAQLDRSTMRLATALPRSARHWGLARKVLNIFLRDAAYTVHLREAFQLERCEHLLELPLDSITARRLRLPARRGVLPRWLGVRGLTAEASHTYQTAAQAIADLRGIARVHLDACWWAVREDD